MIQIKAGKKTVASALTLCFFLQQSFCLQVMATNVSGAIGDNGIYNVAPSARNGDIGYRKYANFDVSNGDVLNLIFNNPQDGVDVKKYNEAVPTQWVAMFDASKNTLFMNGLKCYWGKEDYDEVRDLVSVSLSDNKKFTVHLSGENIISNATGMALSRSFGSQSSAIQRIYSASSVELGIRLIISGRREAKRFSISSNSVIGRSYRFSVILSCPKM